MDFRTLQKQAHTIAKDHGWWDERDAADIVASQMTEADHLEQGYMLEHSLWMRPHIEGFLRSKGLL